MPRLQALKLPGLIFILLTATAFQASDPRPIPLCTAGRCIDDVTGQDREGQPQWCQNKNENGYAANCGCTRSCDSNSRGSGCKTYCRTSKCKCDHGCPMTGE